MLRRLPSMWTPSAAVAVAAAVLLVGVAPVAAQNSGFDANGQCVGDRNGDGMVTVDEVLTALNNSLNGCQFMPLALQFRGTVGTEPFACGTQYHGIGTSNADFFPADFRFYIHNIRLVTADGKEVPLRLDQNDWQYHNVALLDFENGARPCNSGTPQTNDVVHGLVPPLTYTGVRFLLGVPFELDHPADPASAPSPLDLDGMFWSWQDGYKFLRVDTAFPLENTRLHVGSMGCVLGAHNVVASCSRPNVGAINLDHFDPSANVIVADLAALLSDSDISANQMDTTLGCQSDPGDMDCVPMFKNLGINFSDGSANPTSQKFFRIE